MITTNTFLNLYKAAKGIYDNYKRYDIIHEDEYICSFCGHLLACDEITVSECTNNDCMGYALKKAVEAAKKEADALYE